MTGTISTEPPIDHDPSKLEPYFYAVTEKLRAQMLARGIPLKYNECRRTATRQAWLFAKGRTSKGPDVSLERPLGRTVTDKDGVRNVGMHQKGLAADLYPLDKSGRIWIPPADHELWFLMATVAHSLGLRAGREWMDCPHVEWRGPAPVLSVA